MIRFAEIFAFGNGLQRINLSRSGEVGPLGPALQAVDSVLRYVELNAVRTVIPLYVRRIIEYIDVTGLRDIEITQDGLNQADVADGPHPHTANSVLASKAPLILTKTRLRRLYYSPNLMYYIGFSGKIRFLALDGHIVCDSTPNHARYQRDTPDG